MTHLYLPTSD